MSVTDPCRPLLVTAATDLLDELLLLAAGVQAEVQVAPDPRAARRAYAGAPVVIVGEDAAAACAQLPRRAGVIVVGRDPDDQTVWPLAIAAGAERVVFLPTAAGWLADRLVDATTVGTETGQVVGVIGGRGGAGATSLAVALAITAVRQRRSSLLVDADPLGGGIDVTLAAERVNGLRWPQVLDAVTGRPAQLIDALPRLHGVAVLSWDQEQDRPVTAEAMAAVLDAGRRGQDVVVVDLPRSIDEPSRAAVTACDLVLLVVPAEIRAVAAAGRVAAAVCPHAPDVRVVVRGPSPCGLDCVDVAAAIGLPLAGTLRPEPGLVQDLEHGEPPPRGRRSPLGLLSTALLDGLAMARSVAA